MVLPLDEGKYQRMLRITKTEEGYEEEAFENFSFVPMLKGKS
jgi:protein-L-isoaspartate(D-aspartate) O-methyltransferase